MEAVTIHDGRQVGSSNRLAFDLVDLLRLAESDVVASDWRCSYVECEGELAEELMNIGDVQGTIPGRELLRLASGVFQVVEGNFEARRAGEAKWWLMIRAVDSSFFVVITENQDLLKRIRSRFLDVRDSPEDTEWQ